MAFSKHIFLTGFMGSGKSTLGKKLAALLRRPFVDLDEHIEKSAGKSIPQIFEQAGEAAFREKESAAIAELVQAREPMVIALGGGAICFNDNLQVIKQKGLLIYLELPVTVLAGRIANSKKERPLLKGLSGSELSAMITEKLEQRKAYYSQAHFSVSGLNLTAQLLQQAILEATQA